MTTPAEFAAQIVADYEHDPIGAHDECTAGLVALARGVLQLDRNLFPPQWQRALHALIVGSPSSACELGAYADAVLANPTIAAEFQSAHSFRRWWQHAAVVASRHPVATLTHRLRSLARWRELRALGIEVARAAEAQDSEAIIAAMRRVARVLREIGAFAERGAAA